MGQDRALSEDIVNPTLAVALLFFLACALFMIPMLPAIFELRLKQDAQPLNVVQQYAGDIRHFAHRFGDYVQRLSPLLEDCAATGTNSTTKLPGGDECLLLGRNSTGSAIPAGPKALTCALVIIAAADLALPDEMTFLKEIYVAEKLIGGEGNTYRAVLGEKDIFLGPSSKVMRWAHAAGAFHASRECDLYGRVSSDRQIVLQSGCVFQRLNAPRIITGSDDSVFSPPNAPFSASPGSDRSPSMPVERRVFQGDFQIGAGDVVAGDIVARGNVHIGEGATLLGSVKGNKELVIERGAFVGGSLISAGNMRIGPGCRIHGPVIAERGMIIASDTQCGGKEAPTTVSAPQIHVEEGILVFGTLWARDFGQVVPRA